MSYERVGIVWLALSTAACLTSADVGVLEETNATRVCGQVNVHTRADYEAARNCTRIDGSLLLGADAPELEFEFPELTEITGELTPVYDDGHPHPLAQLRFQKLRTIGGSVTLSATDLHDVEWPELRRVGGQLRAIAMPKLARLALPKLERIDGAVQILLNSTLEQLDLRALRVVGGFVAIYLDPALTEVRCDDIERVDGSASLDGLGLLSAHTVLPLWEASDRTRALGQIGCCSDNPDTLRTNCDEASELTCSAAD